MKRIRETLNEKFEKDSDPIDDMHIGIKWKIKKLSEKLSDMWDENYEKMLDNKDRSQALETIETIQEFISEIFEQDEDN
jgi:hypothetical protein